MATKAGVWIDYKQAIVVLLTGGAQEIKKIAFDIGQPGASAGRPDSKNKHKPKDFVAEDRRERKVESDRKDYYNDVIAAIRGADALLLLGPGVAKGELGKQIASKKLRDLTVELETADKMTERQVAAKVRDHFATASSGKATSSINTATAAPGKRKKKAAK